jgi:hypothetical protein
MEQSDGMGLAKFLQGLRTELLESMKNAKEDLAFKLTKLDVELQVTAEQSMDGSGKIKFWVIEAGAGGKIGASSVQTIKMSLQPILDGKPDEDLRIRSGLVNRPK